jgi:hypothetical protein
MIPGPMPTVLNRIRKGRLQVPHDIPTAIADAVFVLIVGAVIYGLAREHRRDYQHRAGEAAAFVDFPPYREYFGHLASRTLRRLFVVATGVAVFGLLVTRDWSVYTQALGGLTLLDVLGAAVWPFVVVSSVA